MWSVVVSDNSDRAFSQALIVIRLGNFIFTGGRVSEKILLAAFAQQFELLFALVIYCDQTYIGIRLSYAGLI